MTVVHVHVQQDALPIIGVKLEQQKIKTVGIVPLAIIVRHQHQICVNDLQSAVFAANGVTKMRSSNGHAPNNIKTLDNSCSANESPG